MMETFLQQTAQSIIDSMDWQALSRTTLVLPSHRAGIVLKDELMRLQQERHTPAVWAPEVKTLPQLQDYLSPLYPEDELFTIVRLYRLYLSTLNSKLSTDPIPLDLFYGWGRQMLADFTNVDASMPASQVPNFFENTIAAHELEEWKLDDEVRTRLRALMNPAASVSASDESIRSQYEQLWAQLYELYVGLRAEMIAEQKGYNGLRQRAVIEHWEDEEIRQKIAGRTYIFVGFNYLLPVERELMMLLRDAGQARFYWDCVTDFHTNEKAFSFAQLNSGILGSALPPRQWTETKPVTLISCVSREAQAQYVHRWLLENYTRKGRRVGVVICDETMLEPVIYTLPAITLPSETEPAPVNITKGFPLRNTHIYARVLAWLNDRQHGQAEDILSPEFIDTMLADLFPANPENPENLEIQTSPVSLSWQELLILESEYQVRKILNQMRLLLTQGLGQVPFTLKLLRLLMRRTMENVTLPFHGEPVTDIQVMGVLETRLLDFDNLLILNVEEGVLPQRQTDNSFIPYYLRKTYSMQTPDERATVYAYNFFRLLSRAGHTTLLYATAETAEGGKGPSRFIMQMLVSPEFIVDKRRLAEPSILDQTPLDIHYAPKRTKRPDHISPSALNTYIACPRSYYLQYIEGLRPKEEPDVLFEAATLGSFVHKAIEYLYRTYLHCDGQTPVTVLPEQIEALRTNEAILDDALRAAYEQMEQYLPDQHHTENTVIKGYIRNILERDREDAKRGLQIVLLEKERYFPLRIDGIGEIRMGGTIDRLDIVGTGAQQTLRVVDYKSGNYTDTTHAKRMSATWEELMDSEDKGYVRQTLIYSLAVLQCDRTALPIEPHLFFCRRKLTDITTTIDLDSETVHDVRSIKEPFLEALQAKVTEVLTATDFPQCEPDQCPSFCPFFTLCGRKPKEF